MGSVGQRQENDDADEEQDSDDGDAALGAGSSSAENGLAYGVGGEETVLDHGPAVGNTVKEGLRPVPRGVEADGPPERAGAPKTEAEDQADQAGGEQSDGGLTRVAPVAEAEEEGAEDGRGPEAQGFAVAALEQPLVNAGEAARQGVLQVTAGEVLLGQADQHEGEQPERSVTKSVAAEEQALVNDEVSGLPESEDEQGETGDTPGHASEEVRKPAAAAQAVNGVGASLDLRHDPGDEENGKERNGLPDEFPYGHRYLRGSLRAPGRRRIKLVGDGAYTKEKGSQESDKD